MLGHHRPPAKRHLNGVSMVGREWPAFSAILNPLFPHKTKKQKKKEKKKKRKKKTERKTCQSLTPLAKLSGSAHVLYFAFAPSH